MTRGCEMQRWDVSHHLSFQLLVAVVQLSTDVILKKLFHALPPTKGSSTVTHAYFACFNATLVFH